MLIYASLMTYVLMCIYSTREGGGVTMQIIVKCTLARAHDDKQPGQIVY